MARTISMKTVKDSTTKPNGKTLPGYKSLGLHLDICFYEIEDGDKTEEGEELEILVIHNSSLTASKQNLIKSQLSYIDTFYHEGPAMIHAMRNITVRLFEHL